MTLSQALQIIFGVIALLATLATLATKLTVPPSEGGPESQPLDGNGADEL